MSLINVAFDQFNTYLMNKSTNFFKIRLLIQNIYKNIVGFIHSL